MKPITAQDLAHRYQVTAATIYARLKAGTLPQPADRIGATSIWTLEQIEEFEREQQTKTLLAKSGLTRAQFGELVSDIRPWGRADLEEFVLREVFARAWTALDDKRITLKLGE